jgi:hypothetical protein
VFHAQDAAAGPVHFMAQPDAFCERLAAAVHNRSRFRAVGAQTILFGRAKFLQILAISATTWQWAVNRKC